MLVYWMVRGCLHDPTTTSATSTLVSYGLLDLKQGDIDYRQVLSPSTRKNAQKADPHLIHTNQTDLTAIENLIFFEDLWFFVGLLATGSFAGELSASELDVED